MRRAPISWGRDVRHSSGSSFTVAMQAAAITLAVLASLPLAFVLWVAAETGWATAVALLWRPRVAELLINTTMLVAVAMPATAVLAVALAWLTERCDLPAVRLWVWCATAPLAIPAFVHSYAWTSVAPGLSGLPAGILISVLAYFPLMYLPVAATLRRLDPALEDSAASLGDPPGRVFRRVVLPQLRLALGGGSLLVGLHLLAEYGLFAMVRFDTFTTAIVDQFQSTYSGPAANMMAGILVLGCLVLLGVEMVARGDRRLARIGAGAARPIARRALGGLKVPALLLFGAVAGLSLGVPLLTLGRWLLAGGFAVWRPGEIGPAVAQTLAYALAGAGATVAAATPMAWLSVRAPGRPQRLLEGAYYVIGSLPGVVVALALVAVTVRVALPLYQTAATVLAAYVLMFLPRALISLRTSLAQAPTELEQAARSLGRSPAEALRRVTLPVAAPGVAAGAALVSLGITNELVATQMLAPNGTQTLATAFWSASSELDYAAAAPYGAMMVVLSLPLTWILQAQSRRVAGR